MDIQAIKEDIFISDLKQFNDFKLTITNRNNSMKAKILTNNFNNFGKGVELSP